MEFTGYHTIRNLPIGDFRDRKPYYVTMPFEGLVDLFDTVKYLTDYILFRNGVIRTAFWFVDYKVDYNYYLMTILYEESH